MTRDNEIVKTATIYTQKGSSEADALENKIQSFSDNDYSVSDNSNEKTYTIYSETLKKKLWNEHLKSSSWRGEEPSTIEEFQVIVAEGRGHMIVGDTGHVATVIKSPADSLFNEFNREREREREIPILTNGWVI